MRILTGSCDLVLNQAADTASTADRLLVVDDEEYIRDLVSSALRIAGPAAGAVEPERPIRVEVGDRPAEVRGDLDRLRQVLDNLLANVREHTPREVLRAIRSFDPCMPCTTWTPAGAPSCGRSTPAGARSRAEAGPIELPFKHA